MTIDSDELNEETNNNAASDEGEVAVPMDAGLFDVFNDDDEEVKDGGSGDMTIDYDAMFFDGISMEDLLESAEIKSSQSAAEDEKPADAASVKPKKKRQSLKIEHADRSLPPPRWHSEAADKLHRKAMQMEM
ncbi:hypothetical protein FisN_8Hh367 [Fistulifera solaris]|jgi:hypothetical protein|uniref:Uncharacterized protein n=1 Tax=Fistulifera solaris TaxID=1519565 RepID=A0A1Z5KHY8_FISSO|nr:hypothetical protein FisN_8Hh367 [Fistulifera solaris]|eukprot:GAX25735.1 hypothetical protein FisN_8Hh367 [Fistulifera solaris]